MESKSVLQEAEEIINGDRDLDYGSPEANFTSIAKGWSLIADKEITTEQVGLMMIWLKMVRHLHCEKRDNLVDIAGYAGCLERVKNAKKINNDKK